MTLEPLSNENLEHATKLVLALWPNGTYDKEYLNCQNILHSESDAIFLARIETEFIGFIQLSLRKEYVEGTTTSPVAYIEGIYVAPKYRNKGVGANMVGVGAKWGRSKGAKEYASDTEIENVESILFHRKMGFKEFNRVACFAKKID